MTRNRGVDILHDPVYNKGTAHPLIERERLGLRGLLPPGALIMAQQVCDRSRNSWVQSKLPAPLPALIAAFLHFSGLNTTGRRLP